MSLSGYHAFGNPAYPRFSHGPHPRNLPIMHLNNYMNGIPAPGPMPAQFGALGLARGPMYPGMGGGLPNVSLRAGLQQWQGRHPLVGYGGGMPRLNGGYGWH